MFARWIVFAAALLCVGGTQAQETGGISVDDLNSAVKSVVPGVTIEKSKPLMLHQWEKGAWEVPSYGIIVKDAASRPIEAFGPVDYQVRGNSIFIPGYDPPPNTNLQLVPGTEWSKYVAAMSTSAEQLDDRFDPLASVAEVVEVATQYIAERMCPKKARPTELTLYLTAGFEFVVGASTGTEVSWNFDTVCPNMGFAKPE